MVDKLYRCAQKRHIRQPLLQRSLGPRPHTSTFYINADEIFIRILSGQSYGVLTFTAAQFEDNGIVVLKKIDIPPTFHIKTFFPQHGKRVLEYMRITAHIIEFL